MPVNSFYPASMTAELRQSPIIGCFLSVPAIQRLHRIAFLGAIDRMRGGRFNKSLRAGTRLQHTLGVVELVYFATQHLPPTERSTAVAAALIHDIGHGPLSHSTEYFFQDRYNINHKIQGLQVLETDPLIKNILRDFRIDLDRVRNLAFFSEYDPLSYLFHYPINADTIEGITRTADFFNISYSRCIRSAAIEFFISPQHSFEAAIDEFYVLKSDVYNNYIFNRNNVFLDEFILHMLYSSPYMQPGVFGEEDSYLAVRYAPFYESHLTTYSFDNLEARSPRRYYIDSHIRLDSYEALPLRYRTGSPVHAQEFSPHSIGDRI